MALSMPIRRPPPFPTVLIGQPNGAVDRALLSTVEKGNTSLIYLMIDLAARSMRAAHAAVLADPEARKLGLELTTSGRGRTLSQQWTIFGGSQARYRPSTAGEWVTFPSNRRKEWPLEDYTANGQPAPGRRTVAKLLNITIPDTSFWVMKQSANGNWPAMSAVPGTSNHGFWIADDLAKVDHTGVKPYLSFSPADLQVIYRILPLYGFYWDTLSENWHVHWFGKDTLTPATIAYEASLNPPPPDYDDDMRLYRDKRFKNIFLVNGDVTTVGPALFTSYTNGPNPVPFIEDVHDQSLFSFMRKTQIKQGSLVLDPVAGTPGFEIPNFPADLQGV